MALFVIGLGIVSAKTSSGAARWLRWLGRWNPLWCDEERAGGGRDKYRLSVLALLIAVLVGAILIIPGIGEDRTFVLSRFYDLWGTLFYFYSMIVLLASLILVFYRRPGGYILSLVVSTIAIGLNARSTCSVYSHLRLLRLEHQSSFSQIFWSVCLWLSSLGNQYDIRLDE